MSSNVLAGTQVLAGLEAVSYPTIGHFFEDGFVDPAIQSLLTGVNMAGPAVTVRIVGTTRSP